MRARWLIAFVPIVAMLGSGSVAGVSATVTGGHPSGFAYTPTWSKVTPFSHPSNRDQVQMAFDPNLKEVVLFGGYRPSVQPLGDTWVFHGGAWKEVPANGSRAPAARWGGGFAFDPAYGGLVLFGGRDLTHFFHDTWVYNATGWHPLSLTSAPAARGHLVLAYDAADGYLWLFGGGRVKCPGGSCSAPVLYNDTWTLTRGSWSNITATTTGAPANLPGNLAAAYDPVLRAVILEETGPSSGSSGVAPATYSFAAGRYHLLSSSPPPGRLYGAEISWDPLSGAVILVGENTSTSLDTTWGYSVRGWTNLTPLGSTSPATRGNFGLAYDRTDKVLVLFGGDTPPPNYAYRSDTWAFR